MKYQEITEEIRNAIIDCITEDFDGYNNRLAEKIGVSPSTIGLWINKKRENIQQPIYAKLCIHIKKYLKSEVKLEQVVNSPSLKCALTGRDHCPFDGEDHLMKALIQKISNLDDSQKIRALSSIDTIQNSEKEEEDIPETFLDTELPKVG